MRLLVLAAVSPLVASSAAPEVEIVTSLGSMRLMLTEEETPLTVANFLAHVDAGFYDGLVFHRVVAALMIQGGGGGSDAATRARAPPRAAIADEAAAAI